MSTYGGAEPVLDALGEPTRRRLLDVLREGERSVGALAREVPISRPAVSQHLKVLKGAGLVSERRDGTRHLFAIDAAGLVELRTYLELFWETALASFKGATLREAEGGAPATDRDRRRDQA